MEVHCAMNCGFHNGVHASFNYSHKRGKAWVREVFTLSSATE